MTNLYSLNNDIIINILNFIGVYKDYKSLIDVNDYFKKLLYKLTDAIYYVDEFNTNAIIIYNEYNKYYKNIFFNQMIIIDNINQLFEFDLNNIKLLDINLYQSEDYYEDEYDIFNENILKNMTNLKYLNIAESNINYLPGTLYNLEYLNMSDTNIKTIPKTLKNLKYLVNIPYYNNNLKYIPNEIAANLLYLDIINVCSKSIYLSKKIKFLESYEGDKYILNNSTIYINNFQCKITHNHMIFYIKNQKSYQLLETNNMYLIPKLYFYCFM